MQCTVGCVGAVHRLLTAYVDTLARFPISGTLKENDLSNDFLPVERMCQSIDKSYDPSLTFFQY